MKTLETIINAVLLVPAFVNLRLFDPDPPAPIDNVNRTTDAVPGNDLSGEMKTFYADRLIDMAEPKLIHDQFGDERDIPKNGGKTIEFRKFTPLSKATKPLVEGVTPIGNRLDMSTLTASVDQYGDWVGISDILDLTTLDPAILQATKLLGSQAGRTLDTITREVLNGGTSVRYAPHSNGTSVDLRSDISADCKLTPDLVYRAVTDLKAMNAEPIGDSYVAIIHPYAAYDIMRNSEWIDVHKYRDPDNIYKGEIGKLGGVRFVETTEAKIIGPAVISDGLSRLTVKTAISESTTSVVVNEELTTASFSTAVPVYINGVANTITAITAGTGQSTLTVGTAIASLSVGAIICGKGAGKDGSAVFSTLFLASNAYGRTSIKGGGLQHIFKPLGSAGSADPLNQRASVGWKATKTAVRLVEEYMLRVESGSAYSPIAESN